MQAVLVQDLCGGPARTSWSSADPFGMFDLRAKTWSDVLCGAVGVGADRLAEAVAPGTQLGEITAEAAEATGLPAGLPVFAGGGDGQCAGLGTNCTDPRQAYANLGTAVVSGVWQPDYGISDHWRTEIAAQGEGYIFENCLRGGAYVVNWFVNGFLGGEREPGIYDRLAAEASRLPIGSEGVLVQPWWGGVMDPYWDSGTRGTVLGLTGIARAGPCLSRDPRRDHRLARGRDRRGRGDVRSPDRPLRGDRRRRQVGFVAADARRRLRPAGPRVGHHRGLGPRRRDDRRQGRGLVRQLRRGGGRDVRRDRRDPARPRLHPAL